MIKFTAAAIALCFAFSVTPADARYRHHYRHHPAHHRTIDRLPVHAMLQCDSSGRPCGEAAGSPHSDYSGPSHRQVANGSETVLGGRRAGFPRAFCGAEASFYVFGVARRELWLAANWIRMFPRTSPAPGMAAARSGHVMILMSYVGGSVWHVHDGNSIAGYVIVDPNGSRYASR